MTVTFDVNAVFVGELEDLETFAVVLSDHPDDPQEWLELQRALFEDEQEMALGMETYCLVRANGAVVYGGVTACILSAAVLELHLDQEAAGVLGTSVFQLKLHLTEAASAELKRGLQRVMADRLPPVFQLA
ncbi:Imm10 family immunity protein [Deinococcus arboris]|nr:Imm10 family immunity protein [Deinococcus arboris]